MVINIMLRYVGNNLEEDASLFILFFFILLLLLYFMIIYYTTVITTIVYLYCIYITHYKYTNIHLY